MNLTSSTCSSNLNLNVHPAWNRTPRAKEGSNKKKHRNDHHTPVSPAWGAAAEIDAANTAQTHPTTSILTQRSPLYLCVAAINGAWKMRAEFQAMADEDVVVVVIRWVDRWSIVMLFKPQQQTAANAKEEINQDDLRYIEQERIPPHPRTQLTQRQRRRLVGCLTCRLPCGWCVASG